MLASDRPHSVESPFVAAMTPAREEPGPDGGGPESLGEAAPKGLIESPFRLAYELDEGGGAEDPNAQALAEFLTEIRDAEFEEAVAALVDEAAALVETRLPEGGNGAGSEHVRSERLLRQHFAPLEVAVQHMFERAAEDVANHDVDRLSEQELDGLLEAGRPASPNATPAFEFFFKKLFNKVKQVAKGGLKLAKKGLTTLAALGLGPLLKKLAALARPLIKRVLQLALNKLPAALRPVARKLVRRFVGDVAAGPPSGSPAEEIEHEFDLQVAQLVFGEADLATAEYESAVSGAVDDPADDLSHARQRFVQAIRQLPEGADPTAEVERFIPAILPALKLGVKLAGRERIVKVLARIVGKLIVRFVGPKYTPQLARAMVDTGLRLMNLEALPDEADGIAGEAVALTVEETVRRTAGLPDYVLDDEALAEGYVVQAFEAAAAANLPPVLADAVYQRRPDLRESSGSAGGWVLLPRADDTHRYFQKYTRVFPDVALTPHVASAVTTFGGKPLSRFLQDTVGVRPHPGLTARVHLYEAIPGTRLSRIARWERGVPGLSGEPHGWCLLHPLTPHAAGMLLGQPALGREMALDDRTDPAATEPGERYYYLEIAGARPQVSPTNGGRPTLRRSSDVRLELNFAQGVVLAHIYLSESDAQEMAVRVRQGAVTGVTASLGSLVDTTLGDVFRHGLYGKVRVNHRIAVLWPVSGYALRRLPGVVQDRLRQHLAEWISRAIADVLGVRPQAFVAASEDPADGMTMTVVLERVAALDHVDRLLLGQAVGPVEAVFAGDRPESRVQLTPGHVHG